MNHVLIRWTRKVFVLAVRRNLKKLASPKVKKNYESYFKSVLTFHGVKGPEVHRIARQHFVLIKNLETEEIISTALQLLSSDFAEEKTVGINYLHRIAGRLEPEFVSRLARVFDNHVYDWATCDGLSGRVLKFLISRDKRMCRAVMNWSKSSNIWRQRASAVSFVLLARHGQYNREILSVCRRTVRSQERFVQLGTGWVLRELFLADPDIVVSFLRTHFGFISREGLRYAIEKMPKALQQILLKEHKKATYCALNQA